MAWQPIETAPKDGTPILLAGGRDDHADLYRTRPAPLWMFAPARARWADDVWQVGETEAGHIWITYEDPTHWMPLPAPPET